MRIIGSALNAYRLYSRKLLTSLPRNANFSHSTRNLAKSAPSHNNSTSKSFMVYSILGAASFGFVLVGYNIANEKNAKKQLANTAAVVEEVVEEVEVVETTPEVAEEVKLSETSPEVVESSEPNAVNAENESFVEVTSDASVESLVEVEAVQNEASNENTTQVKEEVLEFPTHSQYLIVGGGTAAMAAFKSIRANDPHAKVLVITEESYYPYMRPPLSKELWRNTDENLVNELKFQQWNQNERSVFFLDNEFYTDVRRLNSQENGGVAVLTDRKVVEIDSRKKMVRLNDGWEISYDKCLLATGGKPRNIGAMEKVENQERVILFRNIDDFKKLYEIAKTGKNITIVGGGFLGSELACALSNKNKNNVRQIFPEEGNLGKILPTYLSKWVTDRVREYGVDVVTNTTISKAKVDNDKLVLFLEDSKNKNSANNKWLVTDYVVVAAGLEPNTDLARSGQLEVSKEFGGYVVNSELQARDSIWVAGDAACFYDIQLGRRRVEHHDHAVVSGRLAGENMTGAAKPYEHQSMFWSDIGDKIGFEAIGIIDSSLETMGLFASSTQENNKAILGDKQNQDMNQYEKGVVLYFKKNEVVGVLLWNIFERIPIARKVLATRPRITSYEDVAKLFKLNQIEGSQE